MTDSPGTVVPVPPRRLARWAALLLIATMALFGLGVAVGPTTAAHAAPCEPIYHPVTGEIIGWEPCPIPKVIDYIDDPDCLSCPYAFDWWIEKYVFPEVIIRLHDGIDRGVDLLQAARVAQPGQAAQLRAAGLQALDGVATDLGSIRLTFDRVAYAASQQPVPSPAGPHLNRFGKQLATGINLLEASHADPNGGAQQRKAAELQIDRAIDALGAGLAAG